MHSFGLLRGSFHPSAQIARLRTYLRHREKLVRNVSDHVRRMQKSRLQMNLHLHNVISNIAGLTGLHILRDIVARQTGAKVLATHRDGRCHASQAALGPYYRRLAYRLGRPKAVIATARKLAILV